MVINFRARGISRGTRKLTQIPTLIKNKIKMITTFILFLKENTHILTYMQLEWMKCTLMCSCTNL
jgi:hypothetical protein